MVKRWCMYLIVWIGCVAFYLCYREWLSWLFLLTVSALPWFSLLLSLPAMLTARLHKSVPPALSMGMQAPLNIELHTVFPKPRWKMRIRIERPLTGEYWRLAPGYLLPADHCGILRCRCGRGWIYDYMGLFRLPMKRIQDFSVSVRPVPVEPPISSKYHPARALAWKPKRGGGFAENHELRLYRPGDSVRSIHWKASGKTGKLILREPMEPNTPPILALSLCGDKAQLDQKLGQLLYLGQAYLQQSIRFQIYAFTGNGILRRDVVLESDLWNAMDALLAQPPASQEAAPPAHLRARYIGGTAHEKT